MGFIVPAAHQWSYSLGLVDFAVRIVVSVLHLDKGQGKFLVEIVRGNSILRSAVREEVIKFFRAIENGF